MNGREQIRSSVPLTPPRRTDPAERATALMERSTPAEADGTCKLTTRVRADQLAWLHEQARTYHRRHPRAPKLTIEELVRLAVDQLRELPHIDGLVGKYRGG